jgi:hypothetical protein
MTLYATLTFDLDQNVTSKEREKFYAELTKSHFIQHQLTTLWTASFTPSTLQEDAKAITRKIVDEAAAASGIYVYEALVSISNERPMEWNKGVTLLTSLMRRTAV